MAVLFRFVQKKDAENMIEYLSCVGGESDNLSFGEDSLALTPEKEERFLSGFISGKRGIMLVAVDGDKIVGNAIVERPDYQVHPRGDLWRGVSRTREDLRKQNADRPQGRSVEIKREAQQCCLSFGHTLCHMGPYRFRRGCGSRISGRMRPASKKWANYKLNNTNTVAIAA